MDIIIQHAWIVLLVFLMHYMGFDYQDMTVWAYSIGIILLVNLNINYSIIKSFAENYEEYKNERELND